MDILPKSLKKTKLTQWMKERAYEAGIRPVDVLLTSAKKSHEMTELLEKSKNTAMDGMSISSG